MSQAQRKIPNDTFKFCGKKYYEIYISSKSTKYDDQTTFKTVAYFKTTFKTVEYFKTTFKTVEYFKTPFPNSYYFVLKVTTQNRVQHKNTNSMQKCGEFDTLMDILIDWRAFRRSFTFLHFSEAGFLKAKEHRALSNFDITVLALLTLNFNACFEIYEIKNTY